MATKKDIPGMPNRKNIPGIAPKGTIPNMGDESDIPELKALKRGLKKVKIPIKRVAPKKVRRIV